MLRRLLRPDLLFLLGTLQGLLPYLLLATGAAPEVTFFQLSYYPLAIWSIGYVSFWVGTRLIPQFSSPAVPRDVPVSLPVLKAALLVLVSLSLLEMVLLAKVYGGIPLLMFASGAASVTDTNSAEASSGFGLVGLATLILSLLVMVMVLLILKSRQTGRPAAKWIAFSAPVAVLLCVFNGKRQGLFMYLLIGGTMLALKPSRTGAAAPFSIRPRRTARTLLTIGGALLVLPLIAGLANFRNNGRTEQSGLQELGAYYLFPTMNLSLQCIQSGGFGPYQFKPLGVFASLMPAKLNVPGGMLGSDPPRVERTSPNGFYERLQWDTGLWGIVLFPFACGAFCQLMYSLAARRYAALLTYGFATWALFSSPLYNHFLNLLFFPLPAAIFWTGSLMYREVTSLLRLSVEHRITSEAAAIRPLQAIAPRHVETHRVV